jgi:hypothetical protein
MKLPRGEKGESMRRKITTAAFGAATLAAAVALAAPVAAAPGRGCPSGGGIWHLGPVTDALPDVDNGDFSDNNGDGLACHKVNKGQSGKHDFESWTWKDNTN